MRFVDATIFTKWMTAIKEKLSLESAITGRSSSKCKMVKLQ